VTSLIDSQHSVRSHSSGADAIVHSSRVLVTGACGSVGSALVRRLIALGHTVCAFDQSEDGLFGLEQELRDGDGRLRFFLGSVRDETRVRRAMEGVKIVFHCAALKHVYLSEYNPFEAMQTNIIGTNNVIQAALASEVERAILTSSDKSVNPTSTMGATKLLGERLFIAANQFVGRHATRFACVRFGNVLNSNGSVLHIFKRQLEGDQPLTITAKGMTRFFISMSQAVELCLDASARMVGGEIFVKSMGSCDIVSVAKAVSGIRPFRITEIGHKPGEKLYEELVTENEAPRTVVDGDTYVVLPDTVNTLPEDMRNKYSAYDGLPRLSAPVRSDRDLLSEAEVVSMLRNAGILA
jgi:UDP-N-acetylglucosamine 4,6-dehydratase